MKYSDRTCVVNLSGNSRFEIGLFNFAIDCDVRLLKRNIEWWTVVEKETLVKSYN